MAQSIKDYQKLGFRDKVMESVFSTNAKRVLKIA
jgi:predicted TIM-barrel fold metal-dependent hydrolase